MGGVDPYIVLGVSPTSSADEIRAAYRSRMRATHPDLGANERDRARRTTQAQRINAANEILSDPARRADYDASQATPEPTPMEHTPTHRPEPPIEPASARQPEPPEPAPTPRGRMSFLRRDRAGQWLVFVAAAVAAIGIEANVGGSSAGLGIVLFAAVALVIQPIAARPHASGVPIGQLCGGIAAVALAIRSPSE